MSTTTNEFAKEVSDFLRRTGLSRSMFGVEALGDSSFVVELERGRSPTGKTMDRVRAYMEANSSER